MALPPLADVSALASWVGQEIAPEDPRAGAVLSAASALVRSYTGETWVEDGELADDVPDVVGAIVVQVAARVWSNPSGLTSVTIDDATRRWGESGAAGLYLTDAEKEALSPYVTTPSRDVGVLSTTRGEGGFDTLYVPTGPPPSGPPFPWYSTEDFA